MTMSKICTKCNEEKPLDSFYKDKAKKDGLRYNCKACVKEYDAKFYLGHSEELKAAVARYFQTQVGKASKRKSSAKYQKTEAGKAVHAKSDAKYRQTEAGKAVQRKSHANHPLERKARAKVSHEVRVGRLVKPDNCFLYSPFYPLCKGRIEAHHFLGYREEHWLSVKWLCSKHHAEADKEMEVS